VPCQFPGTAATDEEKRIPHLLPQVRHSTRPGKFSNPLMEYSIFCTNFMQKKEIRHQGKDAGSE
jgi:hypothetical protein